MDTSAPARQKALMAVPWIAAAGAGVAAQLAEHSRLEWVPDGLTVLSRGQDCSHLMIVVEGMLESSMTAVQGKRHVISHLGPGQVLGLIPLMDEAGAIHDSSAKGTTLLLLVPRADFRRVLAQHPELADQVIRLLSARARNLYLGMAERSLFRLDHRLARVLLRLPRSPQDQHIAVTQNELAELLGVTRQSVNQELQRMEKLGWIRQSRGRLWLTDLRGLTGFAGPSNADPWLN